MVLGAAACSLVGMLWSDDTTCDSRHGLLLMWLSLGPLLLLCVCACCLYQVALDVQVGDRVGRLVLGLYGKVVPKTVRGVGLALRARHSVWLRLVAV